jgi:hypothetical protein
MTLIEHSSMSLVVAKRQRVYSMPFSMVPQAEPPYSTPLQEIPVE